MQNEMSDYHKITIDNAVCQRRFHLIYDETSGQKDHVTVLCPHCAVVIYDKPDHAPVTLVREENLISAPKNPANTVYECHFNK